MESGIADHVGPSATFFNIARRPDWSRKNGLCGLPSGDDAGPCQLTRKAGTVPSGFLRSVEEALKAATDLD
jgi:hypothetical protein